MPTWESLFRQAVQGKIEAASAVRASTAELWAEIRGTAAEVGLTIGQEGFRLVTEMRSAATARRRGYERFSKAQPSALFDTRMAAPDTNVRSLAVRAVQPQYLVRFDATYRNVLGETVTQTVSMKDVFRPGMTVAEVHEAVAAAAEAMSRAENGTLYGEVLGVDNLRPVLI